jgi:hypothetical protein
MHNQFENQKSNSKINYIFEECLRPYFSCFSGGLVAEQLFQHGCMGEFGVQSIWGETTGPLYYKI